jgi:hypothetical protein
LTPPGMVSGPVLPLVLRDVAERAHEIMDKIKKHEADA